MQQPLVDSKATPALVRPGSESLPTTLQIWRQNVNSRLRRHNMGTDTSAWTGSTLPNSVLKLKSKDQQTPQTQAMQTQAGQCCLKLVPGYRLP